MAEPIIRVPQGLTQEPFNQQILKLKGFSVIESCTHTSMKTGSMFLEDHLLLFVLEGKYAVRFGKELHVVRKNQLVLLKKAIVVEYEKSGETTKDDRLEYMMFFLKDDLLKEFMQLTSVKFDRPEKPDAVPVSITDVNDTLLKYVESLKPYFSHPEHAEEGLVKLKMLELLFGLLSTDAQIFGQLFRLRQQLRVNIRAVMEDNFLKPVSLSDLAYLSGRSLSSFKRDFQEIYNMPPSRWVREKRLEKAKELLAETGLNVTDVCYMTGFESMAHFSRLFKAHFGFSPSVVK